MGDWVEVTATIKYGKGYDDPWLVVKGSNSEVVKAELCRISGLPGEDITLSGLVSNVSNHVHGIGTVASGLGGTVIPDPQGGSAWPSNQPVTGSSTVSEVKSNAGNSGSSEAVLSAISAASSKKELTDLYLKNKKLFESNSGLSKALRDKSSELNK